MHEPPDASPCLTLGWGSSKLSGVLCHYQAFHSAFPQNIKVNTFHYVHSTIGSGLKSQEGNIGADLLLVACDSRNRMALICLGHQITSWKCQTYLKKYIIY